MASVCPRKGVGSPWDRSKQLALLCTGQMPLMAQKFNVEGASHPKSKVQFCQHWPCCGFLKKSWEASSQQEDKNREQLERHSRQRQGLMPEVDLFCFLLQETREGQLQLKSQGQGRHPSVGSVWPGNNHSEWLMTPSYHGFATWFAGCFTLFFLHNMLSHIPHSILSISLMKNQVQGGWKFFWGSHS